jgi:hypothetical protein
LPFLLNAMLFLLVAGVSVHPPAFAQRHMRKYKAPPPMAQVEVTVFRGESGKPLQNVAVVFHPTHDGVDDGNMELKTNEQGKASLNIVPVGSKVLVQVIAPGYRTFGAEYDVPTDKKEITIKLLPPNQQYSIYSKTHPSSDIRTNTPQTQMGQAAPADSPLLAPADEKKHPED